jgi:hypothetical protein
MAAAPCGLYRHTGFACVSWRFWLDLIPLPTTTAARALPTAHGTAFSGAFYLSKRVNALTPQRGVDTAANRIFRLYERFEI